MYSDKTHHYNRKDLKPEEFTDNEWHNKDDELFANSTDILYASKPISEWNNISSKSFKTYLYSNELCGSSPLLDISNLVRDEKDDEDNESCLQLNREDKDSGIQSLTNTSPQRSWQDCFIEPTPGT